MTNARMLLVQQQRRADVEIDFETWQELTRGFDRIVDTFGLIAPVLELAKGKTPDERIRHLRFVNELAYRGHRALVALAQRLAAVQREIESDPPKRDVEDFSDILQLAAAAACFDSSHSLGASQQ